MRLIYVDEALRLFDEEYKEKNELIHNGETHLDNLAEGFAEAYHIIKYALPTVDAVPVVRCKDCKKLGTGECPMEQDYPWISTDSDDFCSYGERRENDEGRN
jgi:hypothetical protein